MRNVIDESPHTNKSGHAKYVQEFVRSEDLKGKDVLDIGCGFGWFANFALDAGAASVTGVERTETDLATARRHLHDERATFRVASALDLPFADGSFDTVTMWEVLEHLPKRTEHLALAQIARVLRPGGVLYLSTPHAHPLSRVTDPAWWVARHRHYQPEQVTAMARATGFDVEVIESKAGWGQVLFMLNLYVAKWVFRRPPFFEAAAQRYSHRDWSRPSGFADVFLRARIPPE